MKNKKVIIILLSLIILIGGILFVNRIYNKPKNKHIRKKNNLAIMVKEDSGEYESSDAIPKGNYVLNEEKTICENGGKVVSYNNSTGQIGFSFLGSDRCSLYFDKIIDTEKPVISNLTVNGTTITATLSDNIELSGYGISTSNSTEPSSWTPISGTSYNLSISITTEGNYYLWVKDSAGNIATKEFTISLGTSFETLMVANNSDIFDENGLRYEGADPNNYICLDNQKSGSCSSSSLLFRIIGLFDEEYSTDGTTSAGTKKLLKVLDTNNYGGTSGKYWSGSSSNYSNNWNNSGLKTELNGTYLTALLATSGVNSKLNTAIVTSKWHLGGANSYPDSNYYEQTITTENYYKAERPPYYTFQNTSQNISQNLYNGNPEYVFAKVGLMYPSDYGYATVGGSTYNKAKCRTIALYNYRNYNDCINNDWLYKSKLTDWGYNKSEWSISPYTDGRIATCLSEYIVTDSSTCDGPLAVRPAFYLNSSVLKIVGGTGTSTDPYHIG